MKTPSIEMFTAGCPCCTQAIDLLKSLACPSCSIELVDMRSHPSAAVRAKQFGIARVPAVVADGELAECCPQGGVDVRKLRALCVGAP